MFNDKPRLAMIAVLVLVMGMIIFFSLRRPPQATPAATQTPTWTARPTENADISSVQTAAVATFASGLTQTVEALPTSTPTETPESLPTDTPGGTDSGSPTASCYRMKYIRDVTIPDNTEMSPAEVFTKTWQVENDGTCSWQPNFKLILIGGEALGGSPFVLTQTVDPGQRIDVSIKMAAPPNETGPLQGTWRMTDQNGTPFGDALTVVIDVGGAGTVAPSTAQATSTP